jgi:hypothetical protein
VPQKGLGTESCTELNVGSYTCNLVSDDEGRIHKSSSRKKYLFNCCSPIASLTLIQSTNNISGILIIDLTKLE